ncbi:MAG: hypothetical protein KC503_11690 [Myxococcales bacterium]|nr:hypothetical protein [Myxococcales bacterium]
MAALLLVPGCKTKPTTRGSAGGSGSGSTIVSASGRGTASVATQRALPELRLDRLAGEVMARGINVLAAKLYRDRAGRHPDENLLLSPLGEAVLLALLDLGPHTALTRTTRMALDLRRGQGQVVLGALLARLTGGDRRGRRSAHSHGSLSVHTALWLTARKRLRAGFAREAQHFYRAEVHHDLPVKEDAARARVSAWLSRLSQKRLTKTQAKGSKQATQMLLASLVDLEASWPLAPTRSEGQFVLGSGKRARVPMLTRRCDGALHTARYDGLDVISLPYARVGSARLALELLLLLPDAKAGEKPAKTLERLRRRVDALALRRWGALVRSRTIEKKRLAKKPRRVDARLGRLLRRIATVGRARPLCVDVTWPRFALASALPRVLATRNGSVLGAALLANTQLGTRAPSATQQQALDQRATASARAPASAAQRGGVDVDVLAIRVDRPFIFVVRERQSGLIVMIGHVVDPRR